MLRESQVERAAARVRLWDLPTRLFHWSLVAAVSTALVTGFLGGNLMPLHGQAGLAILGLLAFRIVWGFVGPRPVRFASFAPTPGRLRDYLRGRWQGLGHNPLGALSVFAMLGLLGAQVATGLFASDDIAFSGPLAGWIDEDQALHLTGMHHQLANLLLGIVALHVAAIVFYLRVKRDNLVRPMITGWKDVSPDTAQLHPSRHHGLALVFALLLAVGGVTAVANARDLISAEKPAAGEKPAPAPAW